MHFRTTTNMMMNTYKYNLMSTTNSMNKASERVQTGRNFTSYSEDPTAATLAFSLRRDLWRNENQLQNTEFTSAKVQVAWTGAGTVVDVYGLDAKESIVAGMTGTAGAGRQPLGLLLQATAESMVNTLNAKYGDHYVFNGDDCMNAPFAWNNDTGNLEYRGININAEPGTADHYKLLEMTGANETNYVDVGIGLESEGGVNGAIIDSTAFNNAFSGLDFIGFGTDEDGDPKCLVSIVKQIGDIFAAADQDSGAYESNEHPETVSRLLDKFEAALNSSIGYYVELDTKADFLNSNYDRLVDSRDNLNEQITSIEDVDPAEAIMEMSYQQYCYSAALKIGTQILSQSLIDYI